MAHPQLPKGLPGIRGAMAYNRYVDGLATWAPDDQSIYRQMADRVVNVGYTEPGWEKPFPVTPKT